MRKKTNIIEIMHIKNSLGGRTIHNDLNLSISKGEIIAIIGGSGCGKTTLLRAMLMLLKPEAGSINIFDIDVTQCSQSQAQRVRRRWGVLFQNGALFSSLNLLENVLFPIKEYSNLPLDMQKEVAALKIALVGLESDAGIKYPAELSGGMQKRAALARAIALDPELLFLDEPTTGLDPNSAGALDQLILQLREVLGLTIVMVTHDLDTLWTVPDRVAFLGEGKVLAIATMKELIKHEHPLIRDYFRSSRSQYSRNSHKTDGH